jgi:PH (Pleckstrin Homology) domain-containing protein
MSTDPGELDPAGGSLGDLAVIHGGMVDDDQRTELISGASEVPPLVAGFLLPYERQVIATRRHPIVLLWPAVVFAGGLAAAVALNGWAYEAGHASPALIHVLWTGWLAGALWAAWKWLGWRQTWFVATSARLMFISGIVSRRVTPLPLQRLSDLRMHQAIGGRKFGWGELICESFATDHALHSVTYLPYIQQLFNEIWLLRMPTPSGRGPRELT